MSFALIAIFRSFLILANNGGVAGPAAVEFDLNKDRDRELRPAGSLRKDGDWNIVV